MDPCLVMAYGVDDFLIDPAIFECLIGRIPLPTDVGHEFPAQLRPIALGVVWDVGQAVEYGIRQVELFPITSL